MRPYTALSMLLVALGLALSACGGGDSADSNQTPGATARAGSFIPSPGNSELVVGPNRVAIAIRTSEGDPLLAGPGTIVQFRFQGSDGEIGATQEAAFVEAIPGTTGFWVVRHTFEQAGEVPAVLTVTKGDVTEDIDVMFNILAAGQAPNVGDPAPPTNNPTLATQPNRKQLTTDTEPDDAFYQMTVTEALAARRPFVVVFATPAFCQTALCGPVLDNVKAVRPEFEDSVNFIHIEPYVLAADGGLAEGQLTAAPSTDDWSLRAEPWIFVVDSNGIIKDRFEGSATPDELRESIQAALS